MTRIAINKKRLLQIVHGDDVVGGQGFDVFQASNVNHHSASDDGRNGGRVGFANAEVAAPVGFFESVVPGIVRAGGDVAESVNLRGNVVADKQR